MFPSRRRLFPLAAGFLAGVLAVCASAVFAAPLTHGDGLRIEVEIHALPHGSEPVALAHGFIEPASLKVLLGDSLLVDGRDVRLRARTGLLIPLHPWRMLATGRPDSARAASLLVSYCFQPVLIPSRVDLRQVGAGPAQTPSAGTAAPAPAGEAERFGDLDVRGSKTIQVSSGSRRDMVVDQNLRLDINGRLTRDISVRAFLSDDNLPVVPEGNTEQLRDIDKVLVELTGRSWKSTLGDIVARRRGTAFGNYRRKIQGVSLEGRSGAMRYEVLAGSPRGRYRTLQIKGQEANQGPYFLGGGDGSSNLFIVAGSERVTLDGMPMVRGADRDYVIDYVRGSVTFTYRRLITSESSIVVEFEEGEGPYGRTVTGAGAGLDIALPGTGAVGRFDMRMITEKDDPGRLRTGELGPEDEAILAGAGDDPGLAVAPGATASPDSTGGYDLVEEPEPHYVANSGHGAWEVSFYYVGPGEGDYDLDTLDVAGNRLFVYRGAGQGSYRVGRPLAMPTRQSMLTMTAAVGDTTGSHLRAEWDVSSRDLNRLSDLDDGDNNGTGVHLQAAVADSTLRVAGTGLGRVRFSGRYDDLGDTFRAFALTRNIFSYRRWGLEERARRPGFLDEADRQWSVRGGWDAGSGRRTLAVDVTRSGLRHGVSLDADLTSWTGRWRLGGLAGEHLWRESDARDGVDPLDITGTNRRHEVSWQVAGFRPRVTYGFERWRDDMHAGPAAAGYRRESWSVGLEAKRWRALAWNVTFRKELTDSLRTATWQREREGRTTEASLSTGRLGGLQLVGEGTLRRVDSPGLPQQVTRLGRATLNGRWEEIGTDLTLGYRVDNSRTEVLDRQIVFVGDRQGDYDQDGRFVGQDLGAYDMVLAGTDSLIATTAVRADLNWMQDFAFLGRDRWYGAWSLRTLAGVEGRSTTDDVGRLLALDPALVLHDSTTVLGEVSLREELTLLRNHPGVDLRGRFEFRQARDRQFATHPEDRLQRSWQVRATVRSGRATSWQARLLTDWDGRRGAEDALSARRSIGVRTRTGEAGWIFTPDPALRLVLQGEYTYRKDAVSGVVQKEWAAHPTLRSRLKQAWTLQGDIRAGNVSSEEPVGSVRPWFFPTAGARLDASLRLAWEPSRFLTVSASWFARKEGGRRWQHDVRLESTARF